MNIDVREMIKQVKSLPPLSRALTDLLDEYLNDQVTFERIGEIVMADPVLAAAMLRVANSAESGLNRTIESIQEAVSYLGKRTVLSIAFNLGVGDLLQNELLGYEAAQEALWEHCQYTAIAAREISKYSMAKVSPDVAYTAGLIHDLGKVVLNLFMTEGGEVFRRLVEDGSAEDYAQAERQHLGVDHSEAGMILATVWRLPQLLRNVIRFHHEPQAAPEEDRVICLIVQAADLVAQMAGYGTGSDSMLYGCDAGFTTALAIPAEKQIEILLNISRDFERSLNSLSCLVA